MKRAPQKTSKIRNAITDAIAYLNNHVAIGAEFDAAELQIPKRRAFDVTSLLMGFGMIRKIAATLRRYVWLGMDGFETTRHNMALSSIGPDFAIASVIEHRSKTKWPANMARCARLLLYFMQRWDKKLWKRKTFTKQIESQVCDVLHRYKVPPPSAQRLMYSVFAALEALDIIQSHTCGYYSWKPLAAPCAAPPGPQSLCEDCAAPPGPHYNPFALLEEREEDELDLF